MNKKIHTLVLFALFFPFMASAQLPKPTDPYSQPPTATNDQKRIANISQLRTAIELYFDDHQGRYPVIIDISTIGDYLSNKTIPTDPATGKPYNYAFYPEENPKQFHIWTELDSKNAPALASDADLNSANWFGSTVNGTAETCTAAPNDCIYDQGQNGPAVPPRATQSPTATPTATPAPVATETPEPSPAGLPSPEDNYGDTVKEGQPFYEFILRSVPLPVIYGLAAFVIGGTMFLIYQTIKRKRGETQIDSDQSQQPSGLVKKSVSKKVLISIIAIVAGAGAFGFYYFDGIELFKQLLINTGVLNDPKWKKIENSELGISFEYPLGAASSSFELYNEFTARNTLGVAYRFRALNQESRDFYYYAGGQFDFAHSQLKKDIFTYSRYKEEDSKFYLIFEDPAALKIEIEPVRIVERNDSLKGLVFDYNNFLEQAEPLPEELDRRPRNELAGILNFPEGHHGVFRSIIFHFKNSISIDDAERVLKSVEFYKTTWRAVSNNSYYINFEVPPVWWIVSMGDSNGILSLGVTNMHDESKRISMQVRSDNNLRLPIVDLMKSYGYPGSLEPYITIDGNESLINKTGSGFRIFFTKGTYVYNLESYGITNTELEEILETFKIDAPSYTYGLGGIDVPPGGNSSFLMAYSKTAQICGPNVKLLGILIDKDGEGKYTFNDGKGTCDPAGDEKIEVPFNNNTEKTGTPIKIAVSSENRMAITAKYWVISAKEAFQFALQNGGRDYMDKNTGTTFEGSLYRNDETKGILIWDIISNKPDGCKYTIRIDASKKDPVIISKADSCHASGGLPKPTDPFVPAPDDNKLPTPAGTRNAQRTSNVNALLNAVWQRMVDNRGTWNSVCGTVTVNLPPSATEIGSNPGLVNLGACIIPTYLSSMVWDPSDKNAGGTGYFIKKDAGNGRITISAPLAEGTDITATR